MNSARGHEGDNFYTGSTGHPDYVQLIFDAIDRSHLGVRRLALTTNIPKSRLGLILHRDPSKRAAMTLQQLHTILSALGISPLEAIVHVEALHGLNVEQCARHGSLVVMLCKMFRELPATIIAGLNELDGIDGTEVRTDWAEPLCRAVAKRVVHEVNAVVRRRSAVTDFDLFS